MANKSFQSITWPRLLGFSSPVLVSQAIDLAVRNYLPSVLTATLGLAIAQVGALLMTARLLSTVFDTSVGWASDRFSTRLGLRRPWLIAGVPIVALGAWGVFWAVPGTGFVTLGAWLLVLQLGNSMIATPLGGWAFELSSDADERVRIMAAKVWLACAGSVAALILPSLLEQGMALPRGVQLQLLGASIIVIAPVTIFFALCSAAEPQNPLGAHACNPLGVFVSMLRMRKTRTIVALYALVGIADAATTSTFLFFIDDVARLPGYGSVLLLVPTAVPLLSLPIWTYVSRLLGKCETLRIAFGWQALAPLPAFVLPSASLLPLIVWLVLRSLAAGADYTLLRAMMADVTREETEGGVRRGATRHTLFNLMRRVAFALSVGGFLTALGASGYDPAGTNSAGALALLRFLHVTPSIVCALAALALLRSLSQGCADGPTRECMAEKTNRPSVS